MGWPRYPRSKYGAKATEVEGIRFASRLEAARYVELRTLESAGLISGLQCQPRYPLTAVNVASGEVFSLGVFIADFRYQTPQGEVIEDAKGMDLPLGRWKRRHAECEYGISVELIRKARAA
jgi:hypothetical protein